MNIRKLLGALLVIPLLGCVMFCGYVSWVTTHHILGTIVSVFISYYATVFVLMGFMIALHFMVETKHSENALEISHNNKIMGMLISFSILAVLVLIGLILYITNNSIKTISMLALCMVPILGYMVYQCYYKWFIIHPKAE